MIKIVNGNKIEEMPKTEFEQLIHKFETVVLDLGTGDGRFIFKQAQTNPHCLFIGVDPSHKQLEIYSKKANKNKLNNVLFIWDSIENMGSAYANTADKVCVYLPWGTLLQHLVKPHSSHISKICDIARTGGKIEIILGYTQENEPSEVERLELDEINEEHLRNKVVPVFNRFNFRLVELVELHIKDLVDLETTWGKKLAFGQNRPMFKLTFSN